MREVNPEHKNPSIDFKNILTTLIEFIKNPVEKISHIPDWNWPSLFFVQIMIAISSGLLFPIGNPAGQIMLSISASENPYSFSRIRISTALRLLPMTASSLRI